MALRAWSDATQTSQVMLVKGRQQIVSDMSTGNNTQARHLPVPLAGERNEARLVWDRVLNSAGVFFSRFFLFLRLRLLKTVRYSEGIPWVGSCPLEVAEINILWKRSLCTGLKIFICFT